MTQTPQNTSPKRHCMIVFAYYPLSEARVLREAEALVGRGHEVDVYCLRMDGESDFDEVNGVKVYRVPMKRDLEAGFRAKLMEYLKFFWLSMKLLNKLHKQRNYGVIQAHNLPDFLVFCAFFQKLKGVPVILDIHDLMPEFYSAKTNKPMDSALVKLVAFQEKISCKFADRVITVSEPWRQDLVKRGVPLEKTSVVMNLPKPELFHRDPQPNEGVDPDSDQFRLFYHGAQAYHHGLDIFIHAIAKVRDQIPNLKVVLHGRGPYHKNLVALSEELKVDDIVTFSTVFFEMSQLSDFICERADVCVIPNRTDIFAGGILPTKLLEYTALRLPSIMSRTPGVEAYFDETMVEFFEPEDVDSLVHSMLHLYKNPQRRKDLVVQSQKFKEKYNWVDHSAEYVDMVEQLYTK